MKKIVFFTIVVCWSFNLVVAQTAESEFEKIIDQTEINLQKAYGKRDFASYQATLDEIFVKFNKLDSVTKTKYAEYAYGAYYNLACIYSLVNEKAKALECLIKSKFIDYMHLLDDTDLINIRNEKKFKECLDYAKKHSPDHVGTLKKAAQYNVVEKNNNSNFSYQTACNESLIKLRTIYNLDSIAGSGNDASRFINLMRWVHNLVPHNGTKGIPDDRNALSMISVCKKENLTLNCRGLAIVLNDVYLAMGFKSRFVTCLPKDSTDGDCHVINMVYSDNQKKWIWMDPTFEAYVMNEKGDLLSLEEVRERLISGKPLILNPDANWNRRTTQTKNGYLYNYMAKNLYRLQCPLSSEFDYESKNRNEKTYVELVPLDYYTYKKPTKKPKENNIINSNFETNNPLFFWAAPK